MTDQTEGLTIVVPILYFLDRVHIFSVDTRCIVTGDCSTVDCSSYIGNAIFVRSVYSDTGNSAARSGIRIGGQPKIGSHIGAVFCKTFPDNSADPCCLRNPAGRSPSGCCNHCLNIPRIIAMLQVEVAEVVGQQAVYGLVRQGGEPPQLGFQANQGSVLLRYGVEFHGSCLLCAGLCGFIIRGLGEGVNGPRPEIGFSTPPFLLSRRGASCGQDPVPTAGDTAVGGFAWESLAACFGGERQGARPTGRAPFC